MKAIVKVKPNTHLLDITYNQTVTDDRPAVVSLTYFIHQYIGFGSLKPLAGDLPDTASDVDFAEFWKNSNGDEELAIQSYLSHLEGLVEQNPVQETPQFTEVFAQLSLPVVEPVIKPVVVVEPVIKPTPESTSEVTAKVKAK
jgi:hypothetical protein